MKIIIYWLYERRLVSGMVFGLLTSNDSVHSYKQGKDILPIMNVLESVLYSSSKNLISLDHAMSTRSRPFTCPNQYLGYDVRHCITTTQQRHKGRQKSRDGGHDFARRQVRLAYPPARMYQCLLSMGVLDARNRYPNPFRKEER